MIWRRVIASSLLLASLVSACAPAAAPAPTAAPEPTTAPTVSAEPTSPPAPTTAPEANPTAAVNAVFVVIKPDGSNQPFTLEDLSALPLTSIISEGSPQEGPALLDVLKAAGVTEFTSLAITGREGTFTFQSSEITPEVVLDFNNRGSVKLASPSLSREQRIRDITKIEVK